jgi:hypothetical protein
MPIFRSAFFSFLVVLALSTSGCASKRQIAVDYPVAKAEELSPLPGYDTVDGDDYYMQLVSDFNFKGDSVLKGGCNELGTSYENGNLSAALIFTVRNEALKLNTEVSGFLYEATSGKCNFRMTTKKSFLTPWMRLDTGKDTSVDYHFFTSTSSDANFSKMINDVNAASGLLAFTGVGAGVAIVGNLAGQWLQQTNQATPASKPSASAKYSDETHTLPSAVDLSGKSVNINFNRLAVFEVVESNSDLFAPEPKVLGELAIFPTFSATLLLKTAKSGLPDAQDLTLADLLDSPIKTGKGNISLKELLGQTKTLDERTLKPNWKNYSEVESSCRQLKQVLKELGFNKFDRNALLYYFLDQSNDWKNYNTPVLRAQAEDLSTKQLKEYRTKNFSGCLAKSDYQTMQKLGLTVNNADDWNAILNTGEKKETAFDPIHSIERQLISVLKNPNPKEIAQQVYPLLTSKSGNGSVLLQNHLGNFGLESLLQIPTLAKEGAIVSAEQLSDAFALLAFDQLSCVRPAPEQGKLLDNTGILLFTTKPASPRKEGGAFEFEVVGGKISRITLQLPSAKDFEQSLKDRQTVGGCTINPDFLKPSVVPPPPILPTVPATLPPPPIQPSTMQPLTSPNASEQIPKQ